MTIKAIRESFEDVQERGLYYRVPDDGFTRVLNNSGEVMNGKHVRVQPTQHERQLYSFIEGLIVEIERLYEIVGDLNHKTMPLNVIGGSPPLGDVGVIGTKHFKDGL